MIKKIIKYILRKVGLRVTFISKDDSLNHNQTGSIEECISDHFIISEALTEIAKIREYTMQNDARLITLFQQAVYCEKNNIPGAFIECGVWKGGAVGLMALANMQHGKGR